MLFEKTYVRNGELTPFRTDVFMPRERTNM